MRKKNKMYGKNKAINANDVVEKKKDIVCNFQRPLMCEIINNQSFYYKSINPYHKHACVFVFVILIPLRSM